MGRVRWVDTCVWCTVVMYTYMYRDININIVCICISLYINIPTDVYISVDVHILGR